MRPSCGAGLRSNQAPRLNNIRSHSPAAQFRLLEMRKPKREGYADLPAGTRPTRSSRLKGCISEAHANQPLNALPALCRPCRETFKKVGDAHAHKAGDIKQPSGAHTICAIL